MKRSQITSLACLAIASSLALGFSLSGNDEATPRHSAYEKVRDSLPSVLAPHHADLIASSLRSEAMERFALHQLPRTKEEWEKQRVDLRNEIIKKAGIVIDHNLPLNYQETGSTKMDGFTIKNIIFQTRPGVYATANLYVPDGKGPFPAVLNVHGHWREGRLSEHVQARGHSLALNGYVCLSVDAFGSGERTTVHGAYEYHGSNLGASLMNVGESLLGFQVSDNMRGVDLLCSLPYVDAKNIGATGASGGGNQTMWVTAIDERIKASMPVVSVGTFESVVMESNCICELLIDGLNYTEASGVLALVAPRAIKMCNHKQDSNPTFYPVEMKRTYNNARELFKMLGVEDHIAYQLFDLKHGYWPEDREAMLGWFDLHLKGKGDGKPRKEVPFNTLPAEKIMVYPNGKRDAKVQTIAGYCKEKGTKLRSEFLATQAFDTEKKRNELRDILRIGEAATVKKVNRYSTDDGWNRFSLETSDHKLIPVLQRPARNSSGEYVIFCHPHGKDAVSHAMLDEVLEKGTGVVLVDLSGTGEAASETSRNFDKLSDLHTLSRAELWLGRSVLGEWVKELDLVADFLSRELKAKKVSIDGSKEAALAGLFLAALNEDIDHVTLRDAPTSYLFDSREGVDFFGMGIHVPGFLPWGDVSLAAGLTGKNVTFINPVTMSGNSVNGHALEKVKEEFEKVREACHQRGETVFLSAL